MTTFQLAIFDDLSGKLGELFAKFFIFANYGALVFAADLPFFDRVDKRALEKAEGFINGTRRSFDDGRFRVPDRGSVNPTPLGGTGM